MVNYSKGNTLSMEDIREKQRQWHKNNSKPYNCCCGSTINVLALDQHVKTDKHQLFINPNLKKSEIVYSKAREKRRVPCLCDCGRTVQKSAMEMHLKTELHKKLMRDKL